MEDFTPITVELPSNFIILVCGATNCGKTERVLSWIRNRKLLENGKKFDKIIYVYNQIQQKLIDIEKEIPELELCDNMFEVENRIDSSKKQWVIFDDFLTTMEENRDANLFIRNFVTVKAHHLNCSTTILIQNYMPKNLRTVVLNLTHLILYRNFRDVRPINTISSQVFGNPSFLSDAMKDQAGEKFSFVCLDFFASEQVRCRNFLISTDRPVLKCYLQNDSGNYISSPRISLPVGERIDKGTQGSFEKLFRNSD